MTLETLATNKQNIFYTGLHIPYLFNFLYGNHNLDYRLQITLFSNQNLDYPLQITLLRKASPRLQITFKVIDY